MSMNPTLTPEPTLSLGHGWGEALCVIAFPGGVYAANQATPHGPDSFDVHGLAVHLDEASAQDYLTFHRESLPPGGEAVSKSYEAVREIAVGKGLGALLLFRGAVIVDVEYLK
jgi:hypothetical protein